MSDEKLCDQWQLRVGPVGLPSAKNILPHNLEGIWIRYALTKLRKKQWTLAGGDFFEERLQELVVTALQVIIARIFRHWSRMPASLTKSTRGHCFLIGERSWRHIVRCRCGTFCIEDLTCILLRFYQRHGEMALNSIIDDSRDYSESRSTAYRS